MWPAKPQISLRIRAVLPETLLVARIFYDCKASDWTQFGISKLKRRLHRLVWVYTFQNATLLEITCRGSYWFLHAYLYYACNLPEIYQNDTLKALGGVHCTKYALLSKIVSGYDQKIQNHKPQILPWHREEESHNHHETPGRETNLAKQPALSLSLSLSLSFPSGLIAKLECP